MWFIGVEVEQETRAPPPKKYPGSAPEKNDLSQEILLSKQLMYKKKYYFNVCEFLEE